MTNPCIDCTRELEEVDKQYISICRQLSIELETLSRLPLEHETNTILIRNLRYRHPGINIDQFRTKLESLDMGMSIRDECTDHDLSTVLSDYRDVIQRQRRLLIDSEMCKYFGHESLS